MYTNKLLEEKYKAQKILSESADKFSMNYLSYVEKEVRKLFQSKGWKLNFSKRKGEWIAPNFIQVP